jgi:hypothetical protein
MCSSPMSCWLCHGCLYDCACVLYLFTRLAAFTKHAMTGKLPPPAACLAASLYSAFWLAA